MGTKQYEFCVMKFVSHTQSELVLVNLIPISWVHNEKDDFKCFYPPKKGYHEIDDSVKNKLPARKHWKSYTVEILYNAGNNFHFSFFIIKFIVFYSYVQNFEKISQKI